MGQVTVIAAAKHLALATALAEYAGEPAEWPGLGRQAPVPLRLILAEDSASLAGYTQGRAPGWGAGIALPASRTILLRADLPGLRETLRHELAHLALHEAIRSRVPLWFDEGYASYSAGELGRLEQLELNLAVASGDVPDLRELDGMLRGSSGTAGAAYALAVSAVLELARRNPSGTLTPLLSRLAAGEPFDSGVVTTTGLTPERFEREWRLVLRRRYSVLTWLLAGGLWAVIAFALAGVAWYRRHADAPRRAALDEGWIVSEDTESNPPVDPGPSAQ